VTLFAVKVPFSSAATRHFLLLLIVALATSCSSLVARSKPREAKVYPGVRNLDSYGGSDLGEAGGYFTAADFLGSLGLDTLLYPYDLTYKPAPLAVEPAPAPLARFRGTFLFGIEQSEFRPEGSHEKWWLSGNIHELRKRFARPSQHASAELSGPVDIVVDGQLSGIGQHGHLGQYKRELRVSHVLEIAPASLSKGK
jgi:uncharacterized protein YceK